MSLSSLMSAPTARHRSSSSGLEAVSLHMASGALLAATMAGRPEGWS